MLQSKMSRPIIKMVLVQNISRWVTMQGRRTELGADQILRFRELVAAILRQYMGEHVG
jgi:hypothetical protein